MQPIENKIACHKLCPEIEKMSYTELESGYQGLRQQNQNRPGFYVGQDGNIVQYVSFRSFFSL